MKNIAIIGSTGSIGVQALDIVKKHRDRFKIVFLSCHNNISELEKQIAKFEPEYAVITGNFHIDKNFERTKVFYGANELNNLIKNESGRIDTVLSAAVGFAGVLPSYNALLESTDVALANKESIVAAGRLMTETAKKTGASIIPVDSEHSAIFQCLVDRDKTTDFVEKVILTASGGPFRYRPADSMGFVSVDEALKHPSWSMGNKITVDSATMMNKGLELIEARYLFDLSSDKLDVYIHPQSIVHSMVSYVDGSTLAQLGYPDMRTPISYALNYPKRLNWGAQPLTPDILNGLTFFKPDTDKYKCFKLALEVLHEDKNSLMIVMNASNEIAVDSFLKGYIDFVDIYTVISKVLERFTAKDIKNIDEIILLDKRVRSETATIIKNLRR